LTTAYALTLPTLILKKKIINSLVRLPAGTHRLFILVNKVWNLIIAVFMFVELMLNINETKIFKNYG